ncbi:MAG: sigma-70 family RNA polymerase sigma factor [Cyclobacteriaceae bacterium]
MEYGKTISEEADRLYRRHYGSLTASLVSFFRLSSLVLAEDIVQSAFVSAIESWEKKGLPDDPAAWLYRVCRNRAIDELRKPRWREDLKPGTGYYDGEEALDVSLDQAFTPSTIGDNRLRLLFAACHPAFSPKARLILTLKTLGGLKTNEIARALNMQDDAVRRSLNRTRAQIRQKNMPLHVPFALQSQERLASVHQVLYLMFNEGYNASFGHEVLRKELCLEAMRQTATIIKEKHMSSPDTHALYALMLFSAARFDSRTGPDGRIIELAEQDRSLWDREIIGEGIRHFLIAKNGRPWSRYYYEAGIASLHASAASFDTTDWQAIVRLYDDYSADIGNSPFVRLNRALAIHYWGDTPLAISEMEENTAIKDQPLYHVSLAELYNASGQKGLAIDCYLEALNKETNERMQEAIRKKLNRLTI